MTPKNSDMIRALIDRDNNTLRDCSSKWPTQDRQPYYALEKSFTDQKGLTRLDDPIIAFILLY